MRSVLHTLIVLFLSAYVLGDETSEPRTAQLKSLFCDDSNKDLRDSVEKCFDTNSINDNKKLKEVTEKCYPGMEFPVTGENARKWHCDNSDEVVDKSDQCMDDTFDELYEDTEAMDIVVNLWECMLDSYNDVASKGGDKEESKEES